MQNQELVNHLQQFGLQNDQIRDIMQHLENNVEILPQLNMFNYKNRQLTSLVQLEKQFFIAKPYFQFDATQLEHLVKSKYFHNQFDTALSVAQSCSFLLLPDQEFRSVSDVAAQLLQQSSPPCDIDADPHGFCLDDLTVQPCDNGMILDVRGRNLSDLRLDFQIQDVFDNVSGIQLDYNPKLSIDDLKEFVQIQNLRNVWISVAGTQMNQMEVEIPNVKVVTFDYAKADQYQVLKFSQLRECIEMERFETFQVQSIHVEEFSDDCLEFLERFSQFLPNLSHLLANFPDNYDFNISKFFKFTSVNLCLISPYAIGLSGSLNKDQLFPITQQQATSIVDHLMEQIFRFSKIISAPGKIEFDKDGSIIPLGKKQNKAQLALFPGIFNFAQRAINKSNPEFAPNFAQIFYNDSNGIRLLFVQLKPVSVNCPIIIEEFFTHSVYSLANAAVNSLKFASNPPHLINLVQDHQSSFRNQLRYKLSLSVEQNEIPHYCFESTAEGFVLLSQIVQKQKIGCIIANNRVVTLQEAICLLLLRGCDGVALFQEPQTQLLRLCFDKQNEVRTFLLDVSTGDSQQLQQEDVHEVISEVKSRVSQLVDTQGQVFSVLFGSGNAIVIEI